MTTQFSAVEPLQIPAANFTGDPLQVTQAFSGLIGRLSAWSQKVAALLNRLSPGGGAVPVSQGGTGDTTLTAHAILVGEGTSAVATVGPGASGIPLIGQGAADPAFGTAIVAGGGTGLTSGTNSGVPYFNTTTTMASSAALVAGRVMYGGTGAGPATEPDWTFTSHVLVGNLNTSNPPSTGFTGTVFQLGNADGSPTAVDLESSGAACAIGGTRVDTAFLTPSAIQSGESILTLQTRGYDGVTISGAQTALTFRAAENWGATAHGTKGDITLTKIGGTTTATVATFNAAGDGGQVLAGNTSGSVVSAGNVGEYVSTITLIANEVNINAAANIATLSLAAGDWDVWGELWVDTLTGTATINGRVQGVITTVSATVISAPIDGGSSNTYDSTILGANIRTLILPVSSARIILSATTNVFLVGAASVSAGTAFGYGKICARRRQ